VSRLVRRGRFIVGTCPAMSGLCRDQFIEVGLVSGRDRRGRVNVGTCSARSIQCRYVFCEVGIVSERVRRGFLVSRRVQGGLVIVGICSVKSD